MGDLAQKSARASIGQGDKRARDPVQETARAGIKQGDKRAGNLA